MNQAIWTLYYKPASGKKSILNEIFNNAKKHKEMTTFEKEMLDNLRIYFFSEEAVRKFKNVEINFDECTDGDTKPIVVGLFGSIENRPNDDKLCNILYAGYIKYVASPWVNEFIIKRIEIQIAIHNSFDWLD